MHSVVLRANLSHAQDALSLFGEYYEAEQILHRDSRQQIERYIDGAQSGIWLIYCGGEPTGCVLYRPLSAPEPAGEVKRLYVRSHYRGHGLADSLMDSVEAFAASQGAKWLYLDSQEAFTSALRLYERRGFEPCPRYNDNEEATIFMRKALAGV